MANTDSFIDEVSEEVRRDRLFALMRKWGWLAVVIVLALVGGAAWLEYARAQERAVAEAFGDGLLQALDADTPEERIAALEAITPPGPQADILLALLEAGEAVGGEETEAAGRRLRQAAEAPDLDPLYRDLALLKAELIDPAPEDEARLILEALAEPGAPYSALAEEQLALVDIRAGDLEAGLERLRALERSSVATAGLQQRAAQLIVSLESGAELVDTSPVEETVAPEPEVEEGSVPETEPEPEAAPEAETGPEPEVDPEAVEP